MVLVQIIIYRARDTRDGRLKLPRVSAKAVSALNVGVKKKRKGPKKRKQNGLAFPLSLNAPPKACAVYLILYTLLKAQD